MDFISSSYCKLTQYLLSVLGLWPYQSLWSRVTSITFTNILLVIFVLAQGATFFTTARTMAYLIDLLPVILIPILCIMILADRYVNLGTMRELLDCINYDWNTIIIREEVGILRHYADVGKKINIAYSSYTFIALMSYALSLFTSQALDIIVPLNETRPKKYPFYIETYVDDDKYFNEVLIILIVIMFVIDIIIVANQLLFMLYIHHVCGMFTVLGYRMDKVLQGKHFMKEYSTFNESYCMYRNITSCVETHLKVIHFATKIDSCYAIYYLIILIGGAVVASLFLVNAMSFSLEPDRILRSIGFLIGQTIHMFLNSYMGQKLTDKSLSISQIIYNTNWHAQPRSVQKLLLLIMLKSSKPCIISAFGLFVLSFECFSTGVQTVISYCMVIRQFQ